MYVFTKKKKKKKLCDRWGRGGRIFMGLFVERLPRFYIVGMKMGVLMGQMILDDLGSGVVGTRIFSTYGSCDWRKMVAGSNDGVL